VALVHFGLGYLLALPLYWFASAGRRVKTLVRRSRPG
jgi:hypothetical protein